MTADSEKLFCQVCGRSQDSENRFCSWCGATLIALKDRSGRAPLDPSAGKNKEGIGILCFLLNVITYHYYSHYWGTVAMVFSALVWLWGRSENWYKNRVRPADSPEIRTAKRLLRIKMTRQGAGFVLFICGAFVFYKYHRLVGGILLVTGVFFGFYELWMRLLLRTRRP